MPELSAPTPLRRRLVWWGAVLAFFLACAATFVVLALQFIRPAFTSVEAIDVAQLKSIEYFVLNRPDGKEDIGKVLAPIRVRPERFAELLRPLLGAQRVEQLPPKIWLGKLTLMLVDGRRQTIMLYWVKADMRVRFTLGNTQFESYRYEAGDANELVALLEREAEQ